MVRFGPCFPRGSTGPINTAQVAIVGFLLCLVNPWFGILAGIGLVIYMLIKANELQQWINGKMEDHGY